MLEPPIPREVSILHHASHAEVHLRQVGVTSVNTYFCLSVLSSFEGEHS